VYRFFHTPVLLQKLLPQFTWRVSTAEPTVFLTFDDGPIPEVTEFVLDQLAQFGAKATFFCVGDNLSKHPDIAGLLVQQGHRLANHTNNHLSGWRTASAVYRDNTLVCRQKIDDLTGQKAQKMLFRPPYGKISRQQVHLLKHDYDLVMWDVLSYDFDPSLSPQLCLQRCLALTQRGSIIVFHDNKKAFPTLKYVLPRYLAHLSGLGYNFATL
jgi:peptidoglycan-N-acetylglucosamine deacetylase